MLWDLDSFDAYISGSESSIFFSWLWNYFKPYATAGISSMTDDVSEGQRSEFSHMKNTILLLSVVTFSPQRLITLPIKEHAQRQKPHQWIIKSLLETTRAGDLSTPALGPLVVGASARKPSEIRNFLPPRLAYSHPRQHSTFQKCSSYMEAKTPPSSNFTPLWDRDKFLMRTWNFLENRKIKFRNKRMSKWLM